ncbi:toprim domain-containing protein [uncultured Roseivirga sp.]|uniref:toprim domain-containing protein n=1 Tax=uncultured Roseivirga sp. TaxID=543088 RepID=UPI0030DC202F|tara:strand:+ start:125 stop:1066 length:942 start_codon:yes stop_codon:yes gene_type:complete
MNVEQAKSLSLMDVLQRQGHSPVEIRKGGRELWFLSPFREELTPSFVVDVSQNIWNDFGESGKNGQACAGGKVIDYMMLYHSTDAKGALAAVSGLFGKKTIEQPAKQAEKKPKTKVNSLEIVSVKKVFSKALFQYLESRKIPREVAQPYIKQVQYRYVKNNTRGFALGFENRSGGFELRNKQFKGLVGKRDITIIRGRQSGLNLQLVEGPFDFLSLLCVYGYKQPQSDVMILNGTAMIQAAIKEIEKRNYRVGQSWFDNDQGGSKATAILKDAFKDSAFKVKSMNHKYAQFKDISQMHESLNLQETRQRFGLG